jgi:trehalose-phosphatase
MTTALPAPDLRYDDPGELAGLVVAASRPLLIGLDIDGVLSPLVDHADDARLLDGMADAVTRLGALDDVTVAAVSGRALSSMRTFGLPDHVRLVGSHGMEAAGSPMRPLTQAERARLATLLQLAEKAATAAGDGAWVEIKTASVAVHVRTANPETARTALADLETQTNGVDGASCKPGSNVLELFARHASKGTAMEGLRRDADASTAVFVGDDVTDEEAFATLIDGDISIKVGTASTIAAHRLRNPDDVLRWLTALDSES